MPYIEDLYDYNPADVTDVETMSDARFNQWTRKIEADCFKAVQSSFNPKYRTSFKADMMEHIKEKFILDAKALRQLSQMLLPMGDDGEADLFILREAYWQQWIIFSKYSSSLNYSEGAAAKTFSSTLNFTPGAVNRQLDKNQDALDKKRNDNRNNRGGRGRGRGRGGRWNGGGRGGNRNYGRRDHDNRDYYERSRSRSREREDKIDDRRKKDRKVTCYL